MNRVYMHSIQYVTFQLKKIYFVQNNVTKRLRKIRLDSLNQLRVTGKIAHASQYFFASFQLVCQLDSPFALYEAAVIQEIFCGDLNFQVKFACDLQEICQNNLTENFRTNSFPAATWCAKSFRAESPPLNQNSVRGLCFLCRAVVKKKIILFFFSLLKKKFILDF